MSGFTDWLNPPPADTPLKVRNNAVNIKGQESNAWLGWLNSLVGLSRQVTMEGTLDFGNTLAQTSAGELTIAFTIGGLNVPVDSFLAMTQPDSAPANSLFTYRMTAANTIGVKFHNYSAGAINPGPLDFKFLIILKR